MSHTTIRIKAGNDAWRELPDNENSQKYAERLSHAATVYVLFDSGEAWELECGKIVKSSLFSHEVIPDSKMPTSGGVTFRNLLTKKQVVWVYAFLADNLKDRLPKKGDVVVFPHPAQHGVSFTIRKTSEPAIYGGVLYEILHYTSEVR
jgi:hypothetical protein